MSVMLKTVNSSLLLSFILFRIDYASLSEFNSSDAILTVSKDDPDIEFLSSPSDTLCLFASRRFVLDLSVGLPFRSLETDFRSKYWGFKDDL